MKMKLGKIISLLMVAAMLLSTAAFSVSAETTYTYTSFDVYADGGTKTSVLGSRTDTTRALDPTGNIVELGNNFNSYGRTEGEKVYRWENAAKDTNLMAWTHGGLKTVAHDQAGEFNVRLHNGALLSLQENAPGAHMRNVKVSDNYWHHVNYAYNYANGRLIVWIDGKKHDEITMSTRTNGLYLRSRTAADLVSGTIIEIDDVRAYALDEASSCKVTYKADGTTVSSYDSFDKIVADKVKLNQILSAGEIIRSVNVSSSSQTLNTIKVDDETITCADVIYEAMDGENNSNISSARIFNSDFTTEYTEGESAIGKILVVEGENELGNPVVATYEIDSIYTYADYMIYSDADTTTTVLGTNGTGNNIRAFAPDTANKQQGSVVTTGDEYKGYGKADGDNIYRWENMIKDGNLMAWGHSTLRSAKHDQVGEFNFRLHNGSSLLIMNNQVSVRGCSITLNDNNWHHLTYAYNSAKDTIKFWLDGELKVETSYKGVMPNGIYLRSNTAMPQGSAIEIDNLRGWALDEASSGFVTYKPGTTTVASYDSFDVITKAYLDNFIPELTEGDIFNEISEDSVKLKNAATCAEVIAAAKANDKITDAKIFDADFDESFSGNESPLNKVLVVYGVNKNGVTVMNYYNILESFAYLETITATGKTNDFFGNVVDPVRALDRDYAIVTTGEEIYGSGKNDGDSFYRFTKDSQDVKAQTPAEGKAGACNLMAWAHADSTKTVHDLAGSFNFRISENTIPFSIYENGGNSVSMISLNYPDNQWHKLSYAYNAAKKEMSFWVDGKLEKTVSNILTYGLYLRLYQSNKETDYRMLSEGQYIDFDNLVAYTTDNSSSGLVSVNAEGETIYDSYNRVVSEKLDLAVPSEIKGNESVIINGKELATVSELKVSAVKALASDGNAYVYDKTLATRQSDDTLVTNGMYLVVEKNGDFRYYNIAIYSLSKDLWINKNIRVNGKTNYALDVINPGENDKVVMTYAKKTGDNEIIDKNKITVPAGEKKSMGLSAIYEEDLTFYVWNGNMAPYCEPLSK